MNDPSVPPLEAILRFCQKAAPSPWYPAAFVRETGFARDQLDPLLNEMRVNGLIRLTDWVPEDGQGYVLTPAGKEAMRNPRLLNRLRAGQVPIIVSNVPAPLSLKEVTGTPWARAEAARDALLGSFTPRVTYALLFANIGMFVAGMALASANNVSVNDYLGGGDNSGAVREIQRRIGFLSGADVYVRGEWWRLVTACFGHIGWIHLAVNMYSLFAVGPLLERIWGSGRFLILYLITGIGGSCGMLIENPTGHGAGASGALWGIMASLGAWIFLNRHALPSRLIADWRRQLLTVFILNVFITFSIAHISKGGHIGGGIVGLITAVPLDYLKLGTPGQRRIALVGLIAIPIICIGLVVRSFHYSGPVIRLADVHDEAVGIFLRLQNRQGGANSKTTAAEVDAVRARLSDALQTPVPRPPVWLPSQERRWNQIAPQSQALLRDLTQLRATAFGRNA